MLKYLRHFLVTLLLLITYYSSISQLIITDNQTPLQLAQRLVGDGVTISNVSFTGNTAMAGKFQNNGQTNITLQSGIVLTTGRAKSAGFNDGVDGNGFDMAMDVLASNGWSLPGDANLATAINTTASNMNDACVLEFDFVPLGDEVSFRYVFSSEEYEDIFACNPDYNDAFAFFISGPGITGLRNIALVPNTTLPVSIENINNVFTGITAICPLNPSYYVPNNTNTYFTHEGHTVVLTAKSNVLPCNTYHLKLVIADNTDDQYDSGVFLEERSLSSNAVELINNTQLSGTGESYLVEGCVPGSFTIRRPPPFTSPISVDLQYGGTAINGVDMQMLPSTITIPVNQSDFIVNIIPIIDNTSEGIETVLVSSMAPCGNAASIPIATTTFQIRDYDILGIAPDTARICRNSSIQLNASAGYATYQWSPAAGLTNAAIHDPVATPTTEFTTYIATAQIGTCNAMDSSFVQWKVPELISTQNVNCQDGTSGQIIVSAGNEWTAPVQYALGNGAYQPGGTFNNLPVGTHIIKFKDGSCIDSLPVNIIQAFPNLVANVLPADITPGNCTGGASGSITVTASGGKAPYQYSSNGTVYQSSPMLMVSAGNYTVYVKDDNGCTSSFPNIIVPFINSVELSTGTDPVICESKSTALPATATAQNVTWFPAATLNNATTINPVANPVVTTTYYITATTGVCSKTDSVTVIVNIAPRPNAGGDVSVCFGGTVKLAASGATDYKWRPSNYLSDISVKNPDVIRPITNIDYYLKVKDDKGCESLFEDTVKVTVTPAVRMFAGNDSVLIAMGQPVQLQGIQVGSPTVTSFSWSPAYGLSNTNIPNPVAVLDRDMTYVLTGKTPINCEGSDTIFIKVYKGPEIYVPTVFTPNGDYRNDVLRAWAIGMKEYKYFRIYNRWGALVFTTSDFNQGWDGKVKGQIQNAGTFVWIAEAVDYTGKVVQRKGMTTIIH